MGVAECLAIFEVVVKISCRSGVREGNDVRAISEERPLFLTPRINPGNFSVNK